jgi:Spy/CpxP family protein refolding chaperone
MIKKTLTALVMAAATLCAFGAMAQALGMHRGGGREQFAIDPFQIVLTPQQRQALLAMVKADRGKLQSLHERLHKAREALIGKLLSPQSAVDVSKEAAELKAAQAAMVDERVAIALSARKLLTPQQLKDAAAFHSKLQDLRRQESQLIQQMEDGQRELPPAGPEE